jgi:TP901 family phage tail tape measure protein
VTGQTATKVSDQMTAIWNNFDDGSESLEYYADVLAKLGADTAASTDEISEGLEKFAAVGKTIGLEYETAAAAVATVVDKTRQSADIVGTSFKTIFARMQSVSLGETLDDGVNLTKYSEALEKVGVSVLDADGQLRAMDDILNDLGEKW